MYKFHLSALGARVPRIGICKSFQPCRSGCEAHAAASVILNHPRQTIEAQHTIVWIGRISCLLIFHQVFLRCYPCWWVFKSEQALVLKRKYSDTTSFLVFCKCLLQTSSPFFFCLFCFPTVPLAKILNSAVIWLWSSRFRSFFGRAARARYEGAGRCCRVKDLTFAQRSS